MRTDLTPQSWDQKFTFILKEIHFHPFILRRDNCRTINYCIYSSNFQRLNLRLDSIPLDYFLMFIINDEILNNFRKIKKKCKNIKKRNTDK